MRHKLYPLVNIYLALPALENHYAAQGIPREATRVFICELVVSEGNEQAFDDN
jgi:hypothetical protein